MRARVPAALAALTTFGVMTMMSSGTAGAAITSVTGSAYGYYSSISLFGGPFFKCGISFSTPPPPCPNPVVTLPAGGSVTPVTASLPSEDLTYGPAHIFDSGPINISTQGAPGPFGTVTSSTSIQGCTTAVYNGCNVGQIYAGPFTATSVSSTCTANGGTPVGSTTIVGGLLAESPTGGGFGLTPGPPIVVPTNPPPNYTVKAFFPDTGKQYTYVFNQQIVNPNGSLTVNAAHEYLNAGGVGANGDLIFGQSVCGATPVTIADLLTAVQGVGPGHSLAAKVSAAEKAFAKGHTTAGCRILSAFIHEVQALSGKKITATQARTLIADANQVRSTNNCASSPGNDQQKHHDQQKNQHGDG
ncbi:MAG: hypothetical protein ACYC1D_11725 [Acidimicrobiales bacterium]